MSQGREAQGDPLSGLKDFQRRTVDHVFRRLWLDDPPTPRFLVADEVGLGKTMVARGVISRTLEHLKSEGVGRIDVAYVCSNAAIAQQNVNRLNVLEDDHLAMASRLTLLPLHLHRLEDNRVNFVSFTPGTTFDLKSSGGIWRERVVLYRLLVGARPELAEPLVHVMRAGVGLKRFRQRIRAQTDPLDQELTRQFLSRLRAQPQLMAELEEACRHFVCHREEIPWEDRQLQFGFIGRCRQLLADACIDALEPDLVILDEFQRFRDLLDGESEAAVLARRVMNYMAPEGHQVRVLLLSATPYKPLTLSGEEEDHYEDFLRTLSFLFDDETKVARVEEHLRMYRRGLYRSDDPDLERACRSLERLLRSVMVRTERVGITRRLDAMLGTRIRTADIRSKDLEHVRLSERVAETLDAGGTVEYWKSAPYILHFMRDYQLKRKLEDALERPPQQLVELLQEHRGELLSGTEVRDYQPLDLGNGRLRSLMGDMVEPGQWKLLWMHPSLPYMKPGGVYAEVDEFTKALVFSAWTVVPEAVSAMCSYEVERRMLLHGGESVQYGELLKARSQLLRLTVSKGRLTGMPTLALLYPSEALQGAGDPLELALRLGGGEPASVALVREHVAGTVRGLLRDTGLWPRSGEGPADQRWYWAAPAILDRPHLRGRRRWMSGSKGWEAALSEGEEAKGLKAHIQTFRAAAEGDLDEQLGRAPDDLVEVLVDLTLGGPAICVARALRRVAPSLEPGDWWLNQAAGRVAAGFRTLFNLPETIALLRGSDADAYWRAVLHYGVDGNLQAVLDEYTHQLRDGLGLGDHADRDAVKAVSAQMADALSLRTAPVHADEIHVRSDGDVELERMRLRTRFALRFADLRDDQEGTLARAATVREAFNSPFRPFVLATTSIGQEGLDFHRYCHGVYHWNLPSNPVDMEQREGRVQRYKGHAVRKNVARKWGLPSLRQYVGDVEDPWEVLFRMASLNRPPGTNDLIPFWVYEIPGGAMVERRVPMFPLSREVGKLEGLQRGIALYRLAFGQPRQEDLLAFLMESGVEEGVGDGRGRRISLEPPGVG